MEKVYEKKIYVKAFQFDGDAIGFGNNKDVPLWAKEAHKNDIIKMRNSETLYIDHREHTDFIENGDYIIKNEFGYIFSLKKSNFEKVYISKDGWIPCSERLPEKVDRYYIVSVKSTVSNSEYTRPALYDKEGFATRIDEEPIAWQPLPESYCKKEDFTESDIPKNKSLSREETDKMQNLLNGNADLNSIDFSKRYACNCSGE